MESDFKALYRTLRKLGEIEETVPKYFNGKPSKFQGTLRSTIGNKTIELGLLHYPWKRSLGVDKINQAYHFSNNTELDGALIIATKFSQSAIDLASRINLKCEKRIVLMEREEFDQLDTMNADQNASQVK